MRKIIYCLVLMLITTTLSAFAMNLSFSENGLKMDADIMRQGDNIYMNYKLEGLNSPQLLQQMPSEHQRQFSQISEVKVNMVMNCSTKQMKIESMDMVSPRGSYSQPATNTGWIPISSPEDVQKLEELCKKL